MRFPFNCYHTEIGGYIRISCAQAFFPKNRNRWKKFSSWEQEPKTKAKEVDQRFPPDVQVKKGFTWSEQLAIAMAALQEAGQGDLIKWVKEVCLSHAEVSGTSGLLMEGLKKVLATVIAWRRRIEKRTKDPVQDVSDEESQSIGEDTIETGPSANQLFDGTRNEKATDYSESAFPFLHSSTSAMTSSFSVMSVLY